MMDIKEQICKYTITKIFTILLLCSMCILAGCSATGTSFVPMEKMNPGQGLVYVYRPKTIIGCGIVPGISVDEVKIGELKNNGYLDCSVKAGMHIIEADTWDTSPLTLHLDVESGKKYYIRWWYESNYPQCSYHLAAVQEEFALREIQNTKKSE